MPGAVPVVVPNGVAGLLAPNNELVPPPNGEDVAAVLPPNAPVPKPVPPVVAVVEPKRPVPPVVVVGAPNAGFAPKPVLAGVPKAPG